MSQYYYPDNFRINDIAAELVKEGHGVRVLTGLPDYATSRVPKEYRWPKNRKQVVAGVQVVRVPIIARRTGVLFRILNYLSFVVTSCLYALFHPTDGDVLLVSQTSPVFQAMAGILWKWRHKKPLILYCYDLWPESMKAWNVKEDSFIFRVAKGISSWIYRSCDVVAVTSRPFRQYLAEVCGVPESRLVYLPQHAEDLYGALVGDYDDNEVVDFLFAGNIGAVQHVDCILQALPLIQTYKAFCVHIVGDGTELSRCRELAAKLSLGDKIIFHGRHPLAEMKTFYRMADCFLLTLRGGDFIGMTLPGKAQGYLSAGRPIVGAIDGAGAEMIEQARCGEAVPAGDFKGLAAAMTQVIENLELYRKKGLQGRQFYEQHYTKEIFMASLNSILEGKK